MAAEALSLFGAVVSVTTVSAAKVTTGYKQISGPMKIEYDRKITKSNL